MLSNKGSDRFYFRLLSNFEEGLGVEINSRLW